MLLLLLLLLLLLMMMMMTTTMTTMVTTTTTTVMTSCKPLLIKVCHDMANTFLSRTQIPLVLWEAADDVLLEKRHCSL